MTGWFWCALGLLLLLVEILVPAGFFFCLLGTAALGVALLTGLALIPDWYWPVWVWQAIAFSILGLVLLGALSSKLREIIGKPTSRVTGDTVGQVVKVVDTVAPHETGTAELWGVIWKIRNLDTKILEKGSEAVVVTSEGITLHVKSNS